jgi:Cys-tRNA(Pro)/Cys-tRNA(Cys) deacylase
VVSGCHSGHTRGSFLRSVRSDTVTGPRTSSPGPAFRMVSAVAGQGTPATALLARQRVPHTLHPYPHDPRSSSYGLEAASVLGVAPGRLFKTLVVSVDGRLAVGVVPVAGSLDLKAIAAALGGKKAAMAEPAAAERATGYVTGGISPLGHRSRLPVVIDASATDWETVYVSAGRRGLQVSLAPADLIRVAAATVAPIAGA